MAGYFDHLSFSFAMQCLFWIITNFVPSWDRIGATCVCHLAPVGHTCFASFIGGMIHIKSRSGHWAETATHPAAVWPLSNTSGPLCKRSHGVDACCCGLRETKNLPPY